MKPRPVLDIVRFFERGQLPTGFRNAGNLTFRCKLPERNTRQLEAAKKTMAAPRYSATVHYPCRAGIARQHAQTNIVFFFNEFSAKFRILLNGLLLALVSCDPTFFSHNLRAQYSDSPTIASNFEDIFLLPATDIAKTQPNHAPPPNHYRQIYPSTPAMKT